MRVLYLGLNYAPEQIGIAVYSTGLCEELAARGHEVSAVVGKPYYPEWRIHDRFSGGGVRVSEENGVLVRRVPLYVPTDPSGVKRLAHHASFALCSLLPLLGEARRMKPDIVITEAPSLIATPVAWLAAKLMGAKSWLHVQDFEVEAAFATGLLDGAGAGAQLARAFERRVIRAFDRVSSISPEMCAKLVEIGREPETVCEFRNWADLDRVAPGNGPSPLREEWRIETPHVALYSGNIANKQGIEILVEAARRLTDRKDLTFVICGQGPNRQRLQVLARGLGNVRFYDLQPVERLNDLMALASIHLLPQKADAADLVLPSKLTNMLASGRPVVATAEAGTGLAREIEGCGLIVPPEDAAALAAAIAQLMDDQALHAELSASARQRAEQCWNRDVVLKGFCNELQTLLTKQSSSARISTTGMVDNSRE